MVDYLSLSPEDLVLACVGSDNDAAWNEFIHRFQPLIANVALKTARHWEEPPRHRLDDLVQETYLKLCADDCSVLRRFQSRHPGAIFGLLKSVAASVVHDYYKSQRAIKRDTAQTDELSELVGMDSLATADGSFDLIERRLQLLEIDEMLIQLFPGKHLARNRMIFWLHHRDGMTAKSIASIRWLGLDIKGVESILQRMKDFIERHMNTRT